MDINRTSPTCSLRPVGTLTKQTDELKPVTMGRPLDVPAFPVLLPYWKQMVEQINQSIRKGTNMDYLKANVV